ncbi:MAG TPA: hypothetical protein VKE51_16875 [Vicinamibacterales bacterium]|nr:hypothetical protein [Vicinamibacterales bacterium]
MTSDSITLNREQVADILKALNGIMNLMKNFDPKSGNVGEFYGVMSNVAAIQTIITGMPRATPN